MTTLVPAGPAGGRFAAVDVTDLPTAAAVAGVPIEVAVQAHIDGRDWPETSPSGWVVRRWRLARGLPAVCAAAELGLDGPVALARLERYGQPSRSVVAAVAAVDVGLAVAMCAADGLADPAARGVGDRWDEVGAARAAGGWPRWLLADLLGVTVAQWEAYEAGEVSLGRLDGPTIRRALTVVGLADHAGIVDALVGRMCPTPFGRQVAAGRVLACLTVAELAEKVGVSRQALARWETGRARCASPQVAQALEGILALPAGALTALVFDRAENLSQVAAARAVDVDRHRAAGETIRDWRVARGLSQRAAAARFGRGSATAVGYWEAGRGLSARPVLRDIFRADPALALTVSRTATLVDPPPARHGDRWDAVPLTRTMSGWPIWLLAEQLGMPAGRYMAVEDATLSTVQLDVGWLPAIAAALGLPVGEVAWWYAGRVSGDTLAAAIGAGRLSARLTVADAAAAAGVPARTMTSWEAGVRCSDPARLDRLEVVFDLPAGTLRSVVDGVSCVRLVGPAGGPR